MKILCFGLILLPKRQNTVICYIKRNEQTYYFLVLIITFRRTAESTAVRILAVVDVRPTGQPTAVRHDVTKLMFSQINRAFIQTADSEDIQIRTFIFKAFVVANAVNGLVRVWCLSVVTKRFCVDYS